MTSKATKETHNNQNMSEGTVYFCYLITLNNLGGWFVEALFVDQYLDHKSWAHLLITCRQIRSICSLTAVRRKEIKDEDDRVRESVISGQKRYPRGVLYDGRTRHSLPHTFHYFLQPSNETGKEIRANGETYVGHFKFGDFHGKGKKIYVNGTVYEGDWKHGQMHGKGKTTYADRVYEGDWKHGKKHGKGKMTFADGTVYEGDWKDGQMHGKGKFTFEDGVYEGDFKDDEMHGKGKRTYVDGVYEGEWKDCSPNGKGKFTWANGDVWYEGEWKDGEMAGKRTCDPPDPAGSSKRPKLSD